MKATYYVIKHLPTGTYLPARVHATHYDFDRPLGALEPRLFKSARSASNCATCWAQGAWTQETRTESHGWELAHLDFTYKAEAIPKAVPGRKRCDLVVLPVEIELP